MFSVESKNLRGALDKVSSVVETTQLHDILDCVLLAPDGKQLSLTGSNGQVQVSVNCEVTEGKAAKPAKSAGSFAVKVRKLNDIMRFTPGDKATFKSDGGKLELEVGTGHYNLQARDGAEYPRMEPGEKGDIEVELGQIQLHTAIRRLQAAISTQTHRVYLAGAFFDFRDGMLNLVGTDGHRLATDAFEVDGVEDASFILPRKAVSELTRLLDPSGKDKVILSAAKDGDDFRTAEFRFPDAGLRLTSQLIQGQYPAYAKVIPDDKTNSSHLVFNRTRLLDGIRQVSSVHDRTGDTVRLISKAGNNEVEIVGEGTATKDRAQIELKIDGGEGFDLQCQLNSSYVQDMLNAFDGIDGVDLAFKDNNSSMLCTKAGEKDHSFRYVVMPVR